MKHYVLKLSSLLLICMICFVACGKRNDIKVDGKVKNEEVNIEKIRNYISSLEPYEKRIPEFSDINNADAEWLWWVVRQYCYKQKNSEERTGVYYDELQEAKHDIFGEKLTKNFPKDGIYGLDKKGNELYEFSYMEYSECREYYTYIDEIKQISDNKYNVCTIPINLDIVDAKNGDVWCGDYAIITLYSNDIPVHSFLCKSEKVKYEDSDEYYEKLDYENLIDEYVKENMECFSKDILEIEADIQSDLLHINSCKYENAVGKSVKVAEKIDEQLIEFIKEKLVSGCSWEKLEGIKCWSHIELKDEAEIAKDIDYEWQSDYYFDVDNNNVKDKVRIISGSALSWCELFWGQGDGNFIKGDLNGGYYYALPKGKDETEGQVGALEFISYKGKNYIIEYNSANTDRINSIDIYFYINTDLIEKINLTKKLVETICEVEQKGNLTNDVKNEEEGKKLLKDYDEVAYPNICFGTAEIEIDREQTGWTSSYTQCDINNDGTEEYCLKCNYGGLGENFYYEINGENNYLDKYGLTYEKIGELKGFWVDSVDEKNILKVVSYHDEKYYFRCYILEWNVSKEIFRMCCYPKFEVLISR